VKIDIDQECIAFERALLCLDRLSACNILKRLRSSTDAVVCIDRVVVPAMERIGDGWEKGTLALAQLYMSGRICEDAVETIIPQEEQVRFNRFNMAVVVTDDYHFLGKRIITGMLRSSGFQLLDYGHQQDFQKLAAMVKQDRIDILLISVLMLRSALRISELCALLVQESPEVRVIVGGAPFRFDDQLRREVGAYATAANASELIVMLKKMEASES